ncbi:hypothetical protein N9K11_01600 [bacterium]|nr:hypothetical protein [bacterium]
MTTYGPLGHRTGSVNITNQIQNYSPNAVTTSEEASSLNTDSYTAFADETGKVLKKGRLTNTIDGVLCDGKFSSSTMSTTEMSLDELTAATVIVTPQVNTTNLSVSQEINTVKLTASTEISAPSMSATEMSLDELTVATVIVTPQVNTTSLSVSQEINTAKLTASTEISAPEIYGDNVSVQDKVTALGIITGADIKRTDETYLIQYKTQFLGDIVNGFPAGVTTLPRSTGVGCAESGFTYSSTTQQYTYTSSTDRLLCARLSLRAFNDQKDEVFVKAGIVVNGTTLFEDDTVLDELDSKISELMSVSGARVFTLNDTISFQVDISSADNDCRFESICFSVTPIF